MHEKYQQMRQLLNEKQWRQYLALVAKEQGSILHVASASGVSHNTIQKGVAEVESGDVYRPGDRIRKPGGGKKRLAETDPTLVADVESIIEPKGDPTTHLRWTTKSLAHLRSALSSLGHTINKSALAELLHTLGFSLKANKKNIEGLSHPDRDVQFEHINEACKLFQESRNPIISVDCKKKELIGNFKNNGREWQAKGENTPVNMYD